MAGFRLSVPGDGGDAAVPSARLARGVGRRGRNGDRPPARRGRTRFAFVAYDGMTALDFVWAFD